MSTATLGHAKREPSGLKLAATLALAGLLSGLGIVAVYEATLPTIQANRQRALETAVLEVVPGSTSMKKLQYVEGQGLEEATTADDENILYAATDANGALAGYAIVNEGSGFQDTIRLIYGYDPVKERILGMYVLQSRETPGLGDKIYKDQDFVANFQSLAVSPEVMVVKSGTRQAENEVDAITGATISSKAVVKIINEANAVWLPRIEDSPKAPEGEEESP